jgi:heat shock protein HtpX
MYIINPFRNKGMAAANLTSTHPPISERIRILRRMDKGASFVDYDQAYQQLHKTGGGGIISAPTIAATGAVGLRAADPGPKGKEPDRLSRTRETDDLLWRQSNYKLITCDCGTKLRIPPKFKESSVRCPHCGKVHPL